MLTLLTYPAAAGVFSLSPFCVKAALLLQHSGQPWQREDVQDPRKTRYGKLPVLRAGTEVIADSDTIRAWLEARGADFDAGLSASQKAHSRAVIRMAEEHLYFILMLDRWGDPKVWPTIRDTYFTAIPPGLRHVIAGGLRRSVIKGMQVQGLGRFTPEERLARAEQDLTALSALLDANAFLFGPEVTAADLSVAPMLDAMRSTPVETALSRRVGGDPTFTAYLDRVAAAVPLPG
ncbi:glutathione S-transferase family protein [Pseudaestuariivita sp.]|uniref:glutathione S-transferase family protein n=1 Tax=Pseudaestuariivita sp. TaxID=2211669 RepID=UPI004058BB0F